MIHLLCNRVRGLVQGCRNEIDESRSGTNQRDSDLWGKKGSLIYLSFQKANAFVEKQISSSEMKGLASW
jgi:hypothetical protein